MQLIMMGAFYTEGNPWIVADTKKEAEAWLKKQGFKRSSGPQNHGLWEHFNGDEWVWARIDRIPKIRGRQR